MKKYNNNLSNLVQRFSLSHLGMLAAEVLQAAGRAGRLGRAASSASASALELAALSP